jgi:beta-glucosidase
MVSKLAVALLAWSFVLAAQNTNPPKYQDVTASPEARAADLVSRMTLEEKVGQMQNSAPAIPRLGVPAYDWWNEALHGVARAGLATVFPQAIGLAATWDTDLEHRIADIISTEARAKYNDAIAHDIHARYHGLTFWSPNINIFRDPRWGRGQETYGEDPYLTAQMAIQFVEGMQGNDPHYFKTISTSKHFAVHSGPEALRHGFNTNVSERELNDTYLYAFRKTVEDAKVDSIMCAYNAVDGVPACASDMLLRQHLRGAWNFQGYVVSDCDSVDDVYSGHHYARSLAEASALAVKAGTDLDCGKSYASLVDAVHQGLLNADNINRAVTRLFTARFRLGMFDPPDRVPFSKIGMDQVESPAHQKAALEAAEKSMVLLKNANGILPLRNVPRSIAVIGPGADAPDTLVGNYNGTPSFLITPLEGIQRKFGSKAKIVYALGSTYVASWTALIPQEALTPPHDGKAHGLLAEYFDNESFEGRPRLTRVEPRGYFNWQMHEPAVINAAPTDNLSLRWSAVLRVKESGDYALGFASSECDSCRGKSTARLYVDDRLLTEQASSRHGHGMQTQNIHLDAGKAYNLRVEYTQHGQGSGVELVWRPPAEASLREAVEAARNSDLTILCLGLNSRLEGEESPLVIPGFDHGDRTEIHLPEIQEKLSAAVLDTGKPVIVVLMNGSSLAIPAAKDRARAILEAWYPGQAGGTAIANTLSGDSNPAGRLPVTFYRSVDQLPAFTDYSMKNRTYRFFTGTPEYPFGYGLSYSDFRYTNIEAKSQGGGKYEVTATVRNNSEVDGDEVVQLYASQTQSSGPELRGFRRIHLARGVRGQVAFVIDAADLDGRRFVSIGSGQPLPAFTAGHFVQARLAAQQ